ncbi:MAG: type ISP restriction/modification enzyme, partial [Bacteroidota bacterium]
MKARIHYFTLTDDQRKEEKLRWFQENTLKSTPFRLIQPSKKHNWINLADNDFEELLPLIDKKVKAGKSEEAVFKLFSRGVETGRDDWVYDLSKENLVEKMKFFIERYNQSTKSGEMDYDIKWTSSLKDSFKAKKMLDYNPERFVKCLYRPFFQLNYYSESALGHRLTKNHYDIYGDELNKQNIVIAFSASARIHNYAVLVSDCIVDLALYVEPNQCLPLY